MMQQQGDPRCSLSLLQAELEKVQQCVEQQSRVLGSSQELNVSSFNQPQQHLFDTKQSRLFTKQYKLREPTIVQDWQAHLFQSGPDMLLDEYKVHQPQSNEYQRSQWLVKPNILAPPLKTRLQCELCTSGAQQQGSSSTPNPAQSSQPSLNSQQIMFQQQSVSDQHSYVANYHCPSKQQPGNCNVNQQSHPPKRVQGSTSSYHQAPLSNLNDYIDQIKILISKVLDIRQDYAWNTADYPECSSGQPLTPTLHADKADKSKTCVSNYSSLRQTIHGSLCRDIVSESIDLICRTIDFFQSVRTPGSAPAGLFTNEVITENIAALKELEQQIETRAGNISTVLNGVKEPGPECVIEYVARGTQQQLQVAVSQYLKEQDCSIKDKLASSVPQWLDEILKKEQPYVSVARKKIEAKIGNLAGQVVMEAQDHVVTTNPLRPRLDQFLLHVQRTHTLIDALEVELDTAERDIEAADVANGTWLMHVHAHTRGEPDAKRRTSLGGSVESSLCQLAILRNTLQQGTQNVMNALPEGGDVAWVDSTDSKPDAHVGRVPTGDAIAAGTATGLAGGAASVGAAYAGIAAAAFSTEAAALSVPVLVAAPVVGAALAAAVGAGVGGMKVWQQVARKKLRRHFQQNLDKLVAEWTKELLRCVQKVLEQFIQSVWRALDRSGREVNVACTCSVGIGNVELNRLKVLQACLGMEVEKQERLAAVIERLEGHNRVLRQFLLTIETGTLNQRFQLKD